MISIYRILKILFFQILIIFTTLLIIISFPTPRHYILSGIYKVPEFYFKNSLKTDLYNRNFESASIKLDRYYSIVDMINLEKNRFTPGFLDILHNAYSKAILDSEKIIFLNLMEKSLNLDPNNIYTISNLFEIKNIEDPSSNIGLYEKAISINPTFKKTYFNVIKNSLDQNNFDLREYCNNYNDQIIGEPKDYDNNPILGKADNKIALYLKNNKNEEAIYLNEGLVPNSNNLITFNINNYENIDKFSLIFPDSTNLSFLFNKIKIISSSGSYMINLNDIMMIASNGIINNNILYNISNSTNKVDIYLKNPIKGNINQIMLYLDINKTMFYSQNICNK